MRKLFYILVGIVVLITSFLLGTPYLLTMFDLDQKLKEYVISTLSSDGETSLNVNNIQIKFGKIELEEIEYRNESAKADFVIRGIEFEYDFLTLIQNIKEPHRAIDKIFLVEPEVTFKNIDEQSFLTDETQDTSEINILEVLSHFDNIDRIHMKNASLFLQQEKGDPLSLAQNLNGWIDSKDFSSISISADGDIFYGSNANFEMFCQANLREESFFIQLDLQDYHLLNAPLAQFNQHIVVQDGIIDGKLDIKSSKFDIDSIIINGYVSLRGTSFNLFKTEMRDLEVHAKIDNNKLVLNDGRGIIANSSFTVAAVIENIFEPEIIGEIRSDRMKIAAITDYFDMEGFENDNASFNGTFKISPERLSAKASVYTPQFIFNDQKVNRVKINLSLEDANLHCTNLTFEALGFNVTAKSKFNLSSGEFDSFISARRNFDEHFFFDNMTDAEENTSLNISGNFLRGKAKGLWNYYLVNPRDSLLVVSGQLGLEDNVFNFSNDRTDNNDFLISLQVANIFNQPSINFGYMENLPFHVLTSREWVEDLINRYDVEGILVGSFSNLNAQITVVNHNIPERQFAITTSIKDLIEIEKQFSGIIQFNQFKGEYDFTMGADYLKGRIQSNHSLVGLIDINLSREEQIRAKLDLGDFAINKLLTDTTLSGYGQLQGQVEVKGNLDDPRLSAVLYGDQIVINDIGYYSFNLELEADTTKTQIDTLYIALNNRSILNGRVNVDYQTQVVDALVQGNGIDIGYLASTALKNDSLLAGMGDYQLEMKGPLLSPKISGNINLSNGAIDNIPFDEIQIAIKDSLSMGGGFFDYKNHHINVSNFLALKAGQYHLEGSGNLPLFDKGAIDLEVQFDGDILWLIPNWDNFFIDGASFTTIKLKVSGTPDNPRIIQGYAKIDRGELWLKDVAKHIQNISGEIYIEENSNNIIFSNISAEVDEQTLTINNVKDVVTFDGKKLEPWFFKNLDLNFGILALETSKDGVELFIPSLMMEGESGVISFSGKGGSDKFYLAGPVESPHAWGEIVLSDSRITFPFPPAGSEEPSTAVKFLQNINWDVEVKAGKDLQYVRNIPGFFGEVNTELNIDPASEGFVFKGVIEKETFIPKGKLTSSRGRIEYLDLNFKVENFGFEINRGEEPEVYGRAWTSVRDSIGAAPKTIYLELYAVDETTGHNTRRARWEDLRFRLVSADPTIGESQEQVLAYLGYSVGNMEEKAKQVGGAVTDNYLIRPLLRPIERGIEKYLGIDFVRLNARIAENLFSLGSTNGSQSGALNQYYSKSFSPYAFLIQSSEFTVGKYLTQDIYLTYTGQIVATAHEEQSQFNLNHSVGLEYHFLKNLLLEFEYDRETLQLYNISYDKSYQEDFKFRFRYSFSF